MNVVKCREVVMRVTVGVRLVDAGQEDREPTGTG